MMIDCGKGIFGKASKHMYTYTHTITNDATSTYANFGRVDQVFVVVFGLRRLFVVRLRRA